MAPDPTVKRLWLGLQLACWLFVAPAEAQWVPNGVPVCNDPGDQGIPSIAADGSGGAFVAWRDYRNRGWSESGAEWFSVETWVDVPAALTLALEGARPNPAVGPFSVAFTLPGTEPATVEMLDVAGRQVLRRDVSELGPGAHVIRLGERGSTPPGMYWLRLSQSGRSLIRRVVVVQ